MMPSRRAPRPAGRASPAVRGADRPAEPVALVAGGRRYRGRLRRLQEPAPAGLRERIARELHARSTH